MFQSCNDKKCQRKDHLRAIDTLCDTIVEGCLDAEAQCIPKSHPKRFNKKFWIQKVKPHRDTALFWHSMWIQAGRPVQGWIAIIRLSARKQYHKAVKKLKQKDDDLRRERMAQQLNENNARDIWKEIRKLKQTNSIVSNVIDSKSDKNDIADLFREKYEILYNSVKTTENEINDLQNEISLRIYDEPVDLKLNNDVAIAINKLNRGKSDGYAGFMSDHLIYSSHKCMPYIALLYNCMLLHGYSPGTLQKSYIISIPKNKQGLLNDSTNYRGISLCNALAKVLDLIIIEKYHYLLNSSNLQFGFKSGRSTTMCSVIHKEIITYYMNRDTNVFFCYVDATKAFDRVHIGIMFKLLLSRKIPAIIIRLLFDIYTRQQVFTKWQNVISNPFSVRQGAILSPLLFSIYKDELVSRLKNSGIGCWISNMYYGALSYADDVVLLCPSLRGLQSMLHICSRFGEEFHMSFNHSKTVCMYMSKSELKCDFNIQLDGKQISWVKSCKYLGTIITPDLNDTADILCKRGQFISSVNNLLTYISKVPCNLLNQLFDTYCCSFYGCQTWHLENNNLQKIQTAYNKALRKIWKLPYKDCVSHIFQNKFSKINSKKICFLIYGYVKK